VKWVSQRTDYDVFVYFRDQNGHVCEPGGPGCPANIGPDFDFGSAPMLTTMPSGRDAIVIGQKSGIGWALDPDKQGAVIWKYRAGSGTAVGGIEWGGAVDAEQAYFPNSDVTLPSPGGLHAVRLDTGARVWYASPQPLKCMGQPPGCSAAQNAAITVIPGVVFSGAYDGAMRAYSTKDGSILWEFDTNREFQTVNGVPGRGGSIAGAGPAIVDGMLYFNSGGGGYGRPGNLLLAFAAE
jgi:polyvinyl alcohol dehydrogenase (cytochrome)